MSNSGIHLTQLSRMQWPGDSMCDPAKDSNIKRFFQRTYKFAFGFQIIFYF